MHEELLTVDGSIIPAEAWNEQAAALDRPPVMAYPLCMDVFPEEDISEKLAAYFRERTDVAFAVLFGSFSRGTSGPDSDIDVGVYFYPAEGELEIEDDVYYDSEDRIWADIDRISGRETDLLVMNRAPSRITLTALTEGNLLNIGDHNLLWRVLLTCGRLFEEYEEFAVSFAEIKSRSTSLSNIDRERLIRIIDFMSIDSVRSFAGLEGSTPRES